MIPLFIWLFILGSVFFWDRITIRGHSMETVFRRTGFCLIVTLTTLLVASLGAVSCHTAHRGSCPVDVTIRPLESIVIQDGNAFTPYIDTLEIIPILNESGETLYDIRKAILHEQMFLILSGGMLYSYERERNAVRPYGSVGRGPGEDTSIVDFCIDRSGKKLLCLVFPPAILEYDLETHGYEGQIKLSDDIVNPSGIFPSADGGVFLYVANPRDVGRESLKQDFYCLKKIEARGKLQEESLLWTDFNLTGITIPVFCTGGTTYSLSTGNLHTISPVFKNGDLDRTYLIDFDDKTLPYRYAYKDNADPWASIGDIFQEDYYKHLSSLSPLNHGVFFSAFGGNSQLWHFYKSAAYSIRWASVPIATAPMKAVTADSTHIYFMYEDYGFIPPQEEKDPLKKFVLDKFGLPENKETSVFLKLKFTE